MRSLWPTKHRYSPPLLLLAALPLAFHLLSPAQLPAPQQAQPSSPQPAPQQQPTPPDNSTYTLHVYTNLVQIPTLVLSPFLQPLPPITPDKFNISLDAGPHFHPTHVRLEGDDPIDLAILFDASGDAYHLQSALTDSILAFATESLRPHDHVSIYALDCTLIRTLDDVPAANSERIAQALDIAIHAPVLHGEGQTGPHCAKSIQLWSALAFLAKSLSSKPGRRIILAISAGQDRASQVKWNELRQYAAAYSITLFGLSPPPLLTEQYQSHFQVEDPFQELCQLTGGIGLYAAPPNVAAALTHILDLVRGRYILEFPRPDNGQSGRHDIEVTVRRQDDFIRPAGITVPIADPALLDSPTTVASPPSPATFGKRHPLDPHK